jgi:EmrB/QacA subfamily drug resistance transporter
MEQMDSTIIATSLPAIAADLHVGPITLKLAMTAYLVALGIFIPLSGWAADKLGAKNVFITAIAVFMAGSALCAVSSSLPEFVAARFLQGMGGAMTTPVGRAIVLKATDKSNLISAMALYTMPAVIGPMVGPPIGGFITTYFRWEWIFLINIPIGIFGMILSSVFIPHIERIATPPVDLMGFFLSGIAAAGLVFGLSVVSLAALPPTIGIAAVITGLVSGALFIRHARTVAYPILDLKLLRVDTFRACLTSGTVFRIAMGAIPFLLPLMLQIGFGLTPFQSGLTTFVSAVGALMTKFAAKTVLGRYGFRTTLLTGAALATIGTAANALFYPSTPYLVVTGVLFLTGFARSFYFTSINILGYADIDHVDTTRATSLNAVVQQISGALGVAFAGMVLELHGAFTGEDLTLPAFHMAFVMVAALTIIAAIPLIRLPADAGGDVSGHRISH